MAEPFLMYTQCPECQTVFRITRKQLDAAQGKVRCGHCQRIFIATEHLVLDVEQERSAPPPATPRQYRKPQPKPATPSPARPAATPKQPPKRTPAPATPKTAARPATGEQRAPASPAKKPAAPPPKPQTPRPQRPAPAPQPKQTPPAAKPKASPAAIPKPRPAQEPTDFVHEPLEIPPLDFKELDFSEVPPAVPSTPAADSATPAPVAGGSEAALPVKDETPLLEEEIIEEILLESPPEVKPPPAPSMPAKERSTARRSPLEPDEIPEVWLEGDHQAHRGGLAGTLGWSLLVLLLCATLVLQYAYHRRESLAHLPELRPHLEKLCELAGCRLPLRTDLAAIELSERDIHSHERYQNALVIRATLVNQADFPQPYPLLEIIMRDLNGRPVASRQFLPEEYLPARPEPAFAAHAVARVELEVIDPGDEAVSFEFAFH